MSINSAMGVLEKKILPTPQLATRELPRILNAQPGDRERVLGEMGDDTRFRVRALLEGVGESYENAETLRKLEKQYRESLTTLTYFNLIGPHQPGIQGVDGVSRTLPTWESIQTVLTPEHLGKIKELEEPRLLVVPWSMDLLIQLNTADLSPDFDYLNYIGAFGTSKINRNLNELADRKTRKKKAERLKESLHFNGWRVVIVEGAETIPEHTFSKKPDELAQEFEAQGFSFMEPEDALMLHLLGFKQKRPYDKDQGTWLNACPNNSDKVVIAGSNKDGTCMQFDASQVARPLIGARRAFEILPSKTPVIVEHDAMQAIEAAQLLEELEPQNPGEEFIVEQGVRDENNLPALLEKLRRARQSAALDLEAEGEVGAVLAEPAAPAVVPSAPSVPLVAESPRVAESIPPPPPPPPPPEPAPPAGGRVRQTAPPLGMPATASPVVPQVAPAPTRAAERTIETPKYFSDLIVALYRLYQGREYQGRSLLNPAELEQMAQQILRAFFSGPGKELYKDEVADRLDRQFSNIERLAQAAGITFDEMKQKIVDAAPEKSGLLRRLFGGK